MDRRLDPRTIVTPYAFSVHPNLLGRPLATPMQRLGAIAVDGVVIFGLTRIGGLSLAIASVLLLFWLAVRKPGKDVFGKLFRFFVGCLGLVVLSVTIIMVLAVEVSDRLENDPASRAFIAEVLDSLGPDLQVTGLPGGDSVSLGELLDLSPDVPALQIVEEGEEDTSGTGAGEDRSTITDPVALDSISALNELVQDLDEEKTDAETALKQTLAELEAAESRGTLGWLLSLIDDLGLGFGWGALYLTIAHTWWKGTSVGKKMFRIRVVMIDQRPLNLWLSFERAGGYAAGLATGLLGFAQIFWDPNRQAIHDKVAETIVIQDGKDPVSGPWIAQGKTQWERDHKQPQDPPKG